MNVIGSRPDGWWRDRTGAALRLLEGLRRLVVPGAEVTLVLDGRPNPRLQEGCVGGVDVTFARRAGRDAGDDRLVEVVREIAGSRELPPVTVVTSDRALAERVRSLGALIEGAGKLRSRLETC